LEWLKPNSVAVQAEVLGKMENPVRDAVPAGGRALAARIEPPSNVRHSVGTTDAGCI
jgi:hypothetical protein